MSEELYRHIGVAEKFQAPDAPVQVPQDEQARFGLDWAQRQQHRPPPEPVAALKPIQAVPS